MIYQLKGTGKTTEEFYRITKELAGSLENKMKEELHIRIQSYLEFVSQEGVVTDCLNWYVPNEQEAGLELLLLGISYKWYFKLNDITIQKDISFYRLSEMLKVLSDSGEFEEEVIRWRPWMSFFISMGRTEWKELWEAVYRVLDWLKLQGQNHLDSYLPGVSTHLKECHLHMKQDKDFLLISRNHSFYYINMIGAQILNRCYRKGFERARKYYIFLPGCMSARSDCQAKKEKDGFVCKNCHPDCLVSRITKQFEPKGIDVRILYHESEMNQHRVEQDAHIGVVGVSCLLNLLSGGFKARKLGYIPQCVVLDYPGCHQHWEKKERICTGLSLEELESITK